MLLVLAMVATVLEDVPGGSITDPQWEPLAPPVAMEMFKSYPKSALEQGVEGVAALGCRVTARGALSDCKVLQETPNGQGFGQAAAHIAEGFRMKPNTQSGAPTEGRTVRLPIRFRLPWSSDEAPGERPVFTVRGNFTWVIKPKGEDIARVYPEVAQHANVEGSGTIRCRIQSDGRLADCIILNEAPAEYHFGAASLRLAPVFRIDLTKGPGLVASGREIDIPIRYQLPRG